MDKAITVESLVALGMTEEEAKRALEAAGNAAPDAEIAAEGIAAEGTGAAESDDPAAPAEADEADEAKEGNETEETANPEPSDEAGEPEETVETPKPIEGDTAGPDLAVENAALRERLVTVGVRACALTLGVKSERVGAVMKLADTSAIDPTADDVLEQIEEAVRRALTEVPELAGGAVVTAGALGAHPRDPARPLDPFVRGFGGL